MAVLATGAPHLTGTAESSPDDPSLVRIQTSVPLVVRLVALLDERVPLAELPAAVLSPLLTTAATGKAQRRLAVLVMAAAASVQFDRTLHRDAQDPTMLVCRSDALSRLELADALDSDLVLRELARSTNTGTTVVATETLKQPATP